jgi:ribosomal protein L30/L7E
MVMSFTSSACSSDAEVEAAINELKAKLENQLIIGSNPDQVLELLQQHKIEHSAYHANNPKISAIVRDVKKTLFGSTSIQLEFLFENDRLTSYTVEKAYTGP